MKIPKNIKIGGQTFEVVIDQTTNDSGFLGMCVPDHLKITLSNKHPKSKQKEVLLHEILHGVFHQANMHDVEGVKEKEEYIVGALAHGLFQVLKDNKLYF